LAGSKPRPVKVCFPGRRTGMGARTKYVLYSLRRRKLLDPAYTNTSRSGNHWTDCYYLYPGRYLAAVQRISNAGNHGCAAYIIQVHEDGSWTHVDEFDAVTFASRFTWAAHPCHCFRIVPQE